ncbi:MAG: NAD(P)H-dependent flavin oxidoreductase [Cytophagales bacterium]
MINEQNPICKLFDIEIPIIQAGMVWCSGWKLASAVSNVGGLGLIGSGSMHPEVLREHIQKCRKATSKPFGVNIPLLYPEIEKIIEIVIEEGVQIVFTSAGNPKSWTSHLKQNNIKVVHVVSSRKFAIKAQEAGVDAVVAEGFEAGGHNGRDETTTLCLVPAVAGFVRIPVIAAGGIGSGQAIMAAFALGASAVQVGTLFAASKESSANEQFKHTIVNSTEGDTDLILKSLVPVRVLKNQFYDIVKKAENEGAGAEVLKEILGKGRSKKGIFEGDLVNGELEIGQIASEIHEIKHASAILIEIWNQFLSLQQSIKQEWNYK